MGNSLENTYYTDNNCELREHKVFIRYFRHKIANILSRPKRSYMLQLCEGSVALLQYGDTIACLHYATDFLLVVQKDPCFCQQRCA